MFCTQTLGKNNLIIMELNSAVCRLCLKTAGHLINVFQEESSNQTVAAVLSQHFWFEIKENDRNKNICSNCWIKVENFHSFYILIYNTHYEYSPKVKLEILDDNSLATKQNESIELETVKEEISVISFKDDDDLEMINESETETMVSDKPNSKSNRVKVRHKTEDEVERENQQIREYFKMECEICSLEFDKFQNVKTHYRKEHNLSGYLRCCNRKYTKRSLLVEHIQRHINPNAFKCELCSKSYMDKRGLLEHMQLHRSTDERPFKCSGCPKSFMKKFLLVRHSYIHKNEEFICEDCGKPFGSKALLQTHKKNVHEGASIHICDICAKVFRSKLSFKQHHQTVHEKKNSPKVQCQICGVWLKDKYYLKQHLDRHDESKVYCNICSNQYLNRKSLRKHIHSVHTDKVYECSMCEKTFKKSISLKEHMATHTGEVLNKCPYCPKTFNSSSNMYSHRKKHHPKEWEELETSKVQNVIDK